MNKLRFYYEYFYAWADMITLSESDTISFCGLFTHSCLSCRNTWICIARVFFISNKKGSISASVPTFLVYITQAICKES